VWRCCNKIISNLILRKKINYHCDYCYGALLVAADCAQLIFGKLTLGDSNIPVAQLIYIDGDLVAIDSQQDE